MTRSFSLRPASVASEFPSVVPCCVPAWSRRAWLARTSGSAALLALVPRRPHRLGPVQAAPRHPLWPDVPTAAQLPPGPLQTLALQAVDAAKAAGAQYADARLTRVVTHEYKCIDAEFTREVELVAVGVRALVNGYWGFAASPFQTADAVVPLARNAVAIAKSNANGPSRIVDLGHTPVVQGTWATPIRIDPFSITLEEKRDFILYWVHLGAQLQVAYANDASGSWLRFARQERVVATSDGSLTTQTCYETAGYMLISLGGVQGEGQERFAVLTGLEAAGKGWELFLDADIPGQFLRLREEGRQAPPRQRQGIVGRYDLVCDGATMAALLDTTLGRATQVDRALGYEANADGASVITDPLDALGTLKIAAPTVTVTANRSAPAQLATVQWDDECVVPTEATLIKDGVLTDFQTTREQAGWLAPYYQKHGKAVLSNGCAAAETALAITMQHMPNLAMTPVAAAVTLPDLVANVQNGILIEQGVVQTDASGQSGRLEGAMREIKRGRLGMAIQWCDIIFDTTDLWKHVIAIGGPATVGGWNSSQYAGPWQQDQRERKGQPAQATSHSVRAPAATIANQPLIDPLRRV